MANIDKYEITELQKMHRQLGHIMDDARELARGYSTHQAQKVGMDIMRYCEALLVELVEIEKQVSTKFKIKKDAESKLHYLRELIQKVEIELQQE